MVVEPGLPPVLADEDAIRRALQNLVSNALKYGAAGRWIGIDARRVSHKGADEVQITVSDRGPGIEAADLAAHLRAVLSRRAGARSTDPRKRTWA